VNFPIPNQIIIIEPMVLMDSLVLWNEQTTH